MELDIHALPGSQNGQNHSGFVGGINFLAGTLDLPELLTVLTTSRHHGPRQR
jgi:hypothetical protein